MTGNAGQHNPVNRPPISRIDFMHRESRASVHAVNIAAGLLQGRNCCSIAITATPAPTIAAIAARRSPILRFAAAIDACVLP